MSQDAANRSRGELIRVRGCRVHNLQNLDLDIPRDRFVVITGPSGSGKSSLAFDTLVAEGQRQYVESLSTYARQFVSQFERPDVDLIEGLPPTVSIDQRPATPNPRSTVATVTEIYDYLRLLYARTGDVYCWQCGAQVRHQTPEQILKGLMTLDEGTRAIVLAPLIRGRRGAHPEALAAIRKAGFVRTRVDGQLYELDQVPELAKQKRHTIEAVVDRIVIREGMRARIAESLQTALRHGNGSVVVSRQAENGSSARGENGAKSWIDTWYSTEYACPQCEANYQEIEPRTFSFNSPYGACPACEGLGYRVGFDPELVLPDPSLSLAKGAIAPLRNGGTKAKERRQAQLAEFADAQSFALTTPIDQLDEKTRRALFAGDGEEFSGVLALLEEEYEKLAGDGDTERLDAFRAEVPCAECGGARLRPEARNVRVGGKGIHELVRLSVSDAREFLSGLQLEPAVTPIAEPILREVSGRLSFIDQVGLGYLTLDRAGDTLSGGERQRIRLATSIGSGLVGACYVLDEPSVGLHPRDNDRLLKALRQLHGQGNTLLVVEHDEAIMRQADQIIDLGPGAGQHGGRLIAQGSVEEVAAKPDSPTGAYLSGRERILISATRRPPDAKRMLTLEGARINNLKNISVSIPLGLFVCVTGVSGSGKSSLITETLVPALRRKLALGGPKPGPFESIRGANHVDSLVEVDQSPIGRTPRSSAATYTAVFDEVRRAFARTREAQLRGFTASRFSFNVKGGRCEACQGQGQKKIEMNFLPDLYVDCPECNGRRFNRQTLSLHYRGKNIADVLDMSVDEATEFFVNFATIHRQLQCLQDVGLGYLRLGQPSTTLSGGEAQRVKLAAELARGGTGRTLYVLDEPTMGLHFDDVRRLLAVLDRLVVAGNTVVVIEHHLDVMRASDWIIDLGPEGGAAGGQIVAEGSPETVAESSAGHTAPFLRAALAASETAATANVSDT